MDIEKFLRKRKLVNNAKSIARSTLEAVRSFLKLVFTKRTILFVTSQRIRSITLGPVAQFGVFVVIAWVANLFYQSLQYNRIINEKSQEISRLGEVNDYFQTEFTIINEKLHKVNDYLLSITGRATPASNVKKPMVLPENLKKEDLSKSDKHTLREINDVVQKLDNIQLTASSRIEKIERSIAITGLNIRRNQGGPLIPVENMNFHERERYAANKFANDINHLILLEKLSNNMPFDRPMKSYFITSGFGVRVDPITYGYAHHQGLDFVGPNHAKIISPSSGKVILAGRFSNYGNAVVIDHGFGITTRYGHLSSVKVEVGQNVKKGDVIALQGNTGRSTGQHLHYEVRYKNTPLNPRKFLEAGDLLFNDKNNKYANS